MPSPTVITVTGPYGSSTFSNFSESAFITSMSPTFGPPGTVVTILGLNMDQVFAISFGTVTTTDFIIVDDNTITVAAPVPDPTFEFVVTVDAISLGGTSRSPQTFTYSEFTTFDPTTAQGLTLAPSETFANLQASNAGSGLEYVGGVTTFGPQTFGKYYYEMKWNVIPQGGGGGGPSFAPSGTAYDQLISQSPEPAPGGVTLFDGGSCYAFANFVANIVPALTAVIQGDTFGFAIDLNNGLMWIACVDGPDLAFTGGLVWNGGGADPNTGAGGIELPLPVRPWAPYVVFSSDANSGDNTITANFGQSPLKIITNFLQKPIGFGFWPSA